MAKLLAKDYIISPLLNERLTKNTKQDKLVFDNSTHNYIEALGKCVEILDKGNLSDDDITLLLANLIVDQKFELFASDKEKELEQWLQKLGSHFQDIALNKQKYFTDTFRTNNLVKDYHKRFRQLLTDKVK